MQDLWCLGYSNDIKVTSATCNTSFQELVFIVVSLIVVLQI